MKYCTSTNVLKESRWAAQHPRSCCFVTLRRSTQVAPWRSFPVRCVHECSGICALAAASNRPRILTRDNARQPSSEPPKLGKLRYKQAWCLLSANARGWRADALVLADDWAGMTARRWRLRWRQGGMEAAEGDQGGDGAGDGSSLQAGKRRCCCSLAGAAHASGIGARDVAAGGESRLTARLDVRHACRIGAANRHGRAR